MPKQPDLTPMKLCQWCKKPMERKRYNPRKNRNEKIGRLEDKAVFLKRKCCSLSCATYLQHSTEPPSVAAARKRAQKMIEGCCEICGDISKTCVHHIDNDPKNNNLENLQILCLHCHSFWHNAAKRAGLIVPGRMPYLFR